MIHRVLLLYKLTQHMDVEKYISTLTYIYVMKEMWAPNTIMVVYQVFIHLYDEQMSLKQCYLHLKY
jgi:hypothetical protein